MVLAQFSFQAPGSWLVFSLVLSLLLLSLKSQLPQSWYERLTAVAWFFIPYLGLLLGGLSPRLMGLSDIDWLVSLGFGAGLILVIILLLILVRATTEGSIHTRQGENSQALTGLVHYPIQSQTAPLHMLLQQSIKNGIEEFHWCFVRAAVWELIQTAPKAPTLPAYWAIWTAAALVAPEACLRQTTAVQRLFSLIVLMATTILFFYTRNFWLCWLLHVAAKFVIKPAQVQSPSTNTARIK